MKLMLTIWKMIQEILPGIKTGLRFFLVFFFFPPTGVFYSLKAESFIKENNMVCV